MPTPPFSEHSLAIAAHPGLVWKALTTPELMKHWMGEPEMQLDIYTSWTVGSPIVITGRHYGTFVNTGAVLHFEPTRRLRYSHLSSLSGLTDIPEHHTTVELGLVPTGDDVTVVTVTLSSFPTESIFKHLDFYWRGTLPVLKRFVETDLSLAPFDGRVSARPVRRA